MLILCNWNIVLFYAVYRKTALEYFNPISSNLIKVYLFLILSCQQCVKVTLFYEHILFVGVCLLPSSNYYRFWLIWCIYLFKEWFIFNVFFLLIDYSIAHLSGDPAGGFRIQPRLEGTKNSRGSRADQWILWRLLIKKHVTTSILFTKIALQYRLLFHTFHRPYSITLIVACCATDPMYASLFSAVEKKNEFDWFLAEYIPYEDCVGRLVCVLDAIFYMHPKPY